MLEQLGRLMYLEVDVKHRGGFATGSRYLRWARRASGARFASVHNSNG